MYIVGVTVGARQHKPLEKSELGLWGGDGMGEGGVMCSGRRTWGAFQYVWGKGQVLGAGKGKGKWCVACLGMCIVAQWGRGDGCRVAWMCAAAATPHSRTQRVVVPGNAGRWQLPAVGLGTAFIFCRCSRLSPPFLLSPSSLSSPGGPSFF
jgi:hypothetical protein